MQMLFEMQEKALLLCTAEWDAQRGKKRPYLAVPMNGALVRTVFGNLLEDYHVMEFVSLFSREPIELPEGFEAILPLHTRFLRRLFKGNEYLCFAPVHPSLIDKDSVHLTGEVRAQLTEQLAAVPGSSIDDFTPEWPGNGCLLIVKDVQQLIKSLNRFKLSTEEEFVTAAILLSEGFVRSDDIGSMVIFYNEDAVLGVAMTGTEPFFALEDPEKEKENEDSASGEAADAGVMMHGDEALPGEEDPDAEEALDVDGELDDEDSWMPVFFGGGAGARDVENSPLDDDGDIGESKADMDIEGGAEEASGLEEKTMPVARVDAGWKTAGYGMKSGGAVDQEIEEMEKTVLMRKMERTVYRGDEASAAPSVAAEPEEAEDDDAPYADESAPRKGRWNPFARLAARRAQRAAEEELADGETDEDEAFAGDDGVTDDGTGAASGETKVLPRQTLWSRFATFDEAEENRLPEQDDEDKP